MPDYKVYSPLFPEDMNGVKLIRVKMTRDNSELNWMFIPEDENWIDLDDDDLEILLSVPVKDSIIIADNEIAFIEEL